MPVEPTQAQQHDQAGFPVPRTVRVGLFLIAMTAVAMTMLVAFAGGNVLVLLVGAVVVAGIALGVVWAFRRRPIVAWLVGLGITLFLSHTLSMALVSAWFDATFFDVFGTVPGRKARLVYADRTLALSDGAAIVVVEIEPDTLQELRDAAGFERDVEAEDRLADSRSAPQALRSLAVGTDFLDDLEPGPHLEVYIRGEGPERTLYRVVYDPTSGRAYAFWLRF